MVRMADKLFDGDHRVPVPAAGRFEAPLVTVAAAMGGHLRGGPGGGQTIGRAQPTRATADRAAQLRPLARVPGRSGMAPIEGRAALGLKDTDGVTV